jgi:hypothetical protein
VTSKILVSEAQMKPGEKLADPVNFLLAARIGYGSFIVVFKPTILIATDTTLGLSSACRCVLSTRQSDFDKANKQRQWRCEVGRRANIHVTAFLVRGQGIRETILNAVDWGDSAIFGCNAAFYTLIHDDKLP